MPSIVLKKIFKKKDTSYSNEKGLSFHGSSVTQSLIDHVNDALRTIKLNTKATNVYKHPMFVYMESNTNLAGYNHYYAEMNHSYQKYHEEDTIAEILDVMEAMGWNFKFQYDSEYSSKTFGSGDTSTSNELWIFHKTPIEYKIFKESVDTKVGIVLMSTSSNDHGGQVVIVQKVNDGSLFEATGLTAGNVVLSINDIPVKGKTTKQAISLITQRKGVIKLMAY